MVKLSEAVQPLARQRTEFVHGVSPAFLQARNDAALLAVWHRCARAAGSAVGTGMSWAFSWDALQSGLVAQPLHQLTTACAGTHTIIAIDAAQIDYEAAVQCISCCVFHAPRDANSLMYIFVAHAGWRAQGAAGC